MKTIKFTASMDRARRARAIFDAADGKTIKAGALVLADGRRVDINADGSGVQGPVLPLADHAELELEER